MTAPHVVLDLESANAWREERGFTFTDLAREMGRDRTLVSRIFNGERNATPAFINQLADVLKVRKVLLIQNPNSHESYRQQAVAS